MPENNVSDLITDQEIAFARLVLSGTMTDRQAAEAVGLDPNSARLHQIQAACPRLHAGESRRRRAKTRRAGYRRTTSA
jgi:hypothetical protein